MKIYVYETGDDAARAIVDYVQTFERIIGSFTDSYFSKFSCVNNLAGTSAAGKKAELSYRKISFAKNLYHFLAYGPRGPQNTYIIFFKLFFTH